MSKEEILKTLPQKNCGLCGFKTCEEMAQAMTSKPELIELCTIRATCNPSIKESEKFEPLTFKDFLGREFDFVLDKFPKDKGPKESIFPFNPANVEKLKLKKGDVIFGRPAWISCGCPVTHVGLIVEKPDYFNGVIVWNIMGPLFGRQKGAIDIGYYNAIAYEGIVKDVKPGVELKIGMRYFFQARYCMMQWRHSGVINFMQNTSDGLHVRIEGIWIA